MSNRFQSSRTATDDTSSTQTIFSASAGDDEANARQKQFNAIKVARNHETAIITTLRAQDTASNG